MIEELKVGIKIKNLIIRVEGVLITKESAKTEIVQSRHGIKSTLSQDLTEVLQEGANSKVTCKVEMLSVHELVKKCDVILNKVHIVYCYSLRPEGVWGRECPESITIVDVVKATERYKIGKTEESVRRALTRRVRFEGLKLNLSRHTEVTSNGGYSIPLSGDKDELHVHDYAIDKLSAINADIEVVQITDGEIEGRVKRLPGAVYNLKEEPETLKDYTIIIVKFDIER